jgi:hypothetical protein
MTATLSARNAPIAALIPAVLLGALTRTFVRKIERVSVRTRSMVGRDTIVSIRGFPDGLPREQEVCP